jgi:hypothetical protein
LQVTFRDPEKKREKLLSTGAKDNATLSTTIKLMQCQSLVIVKEVERKASIVMTIDQYQFRHSYHTTSSSLRIEFEENKVVIFVIILFWIGNVGATSQCFVKGLGQLRFLSHIDFVQDGCEVNWKTIT